MRSMVPHIFGTSLSAQALYCAGTREILEEFLEGKPYRTEYLIAYKGRLELTPITTVNSNGQSRRADVRTDEIP